MNTYSGIAWCGGFICSSVLLLVDSKMEFKSNASIMGLSIGKKPGWRKAFLFVFSSLLHLS